MIGRIIKSNSGTYEIHMEDNTFISLRGSGSLRYKYVAADSNFNYSTNIHSKKTNSLNMKISPKVGDFALVEANMIKDILPRKNELIRPDIANIDQIVLVISAKEPDFSFYLLDLFLVNALREKITPVIVVSKMDLLSSDEYSDLKTKMDYYSNLGYQVIFVNSIISQNTELLLPLLKDKVTVFSGQTGAGKSSLINSILPDLELKTQEISKALGRGKHTTRETSLYLYNGGYIGDTPGFSKLDLRGITDKTLKNYFIEFKEYTCKFNSCNHEMNSLGCGIKDNSLILESRYKNYLKMLENIKGSKRK